MDILSKEALTTLEQSFGTRFVLHTDRGVEAPSSEGDLASVFPQNAEEVELLARLSARHSIPLVARGAGTALYSARAPRALAVHFDAMRAIRVPESKEPGSVEVQPGVTWGTLEGYLGKRGMGPRVYPTSAPRSTVGGWLAENGVGVGSYEYGWLLQNVLGVEVVLAGGERSVMEGNALKHFVGSRGSMGFVVTAWLTTRRAAEDVPVAALFRGVEDLGNAVLDLYREGTPLWHLGFLNAAMARARGLDQAYMLFGAYPRERTSYVEPALQRAIESHSGDILLRKEARRIWEQRFFPADSLGPAPRPGRGFVQGARLPHTLVEIERKLRGVAIQGTVARWGEVSLLAFDPNYGSTGVVDLSVAADIELMQASGRSWIPRWR